MQVQIVSLDDPAKILGPDENGEIAILGPNIFKGYWQNPEETQRAFTPSGFFLTGDIGMLDEHGLMHLVDRKKDMIISGGFNVYPTVIEAAIYEHASVEECIVIGVADAYRGQAAKAYIKLRDGAAPFSLENLHEFLETPHRPLRDALRPGIPRRLAQNPGRETLQNSLHRRNLSPNKPGMTPMDLNLSPEETAFRDEVRAFIKAELRPKFNAKSSSARNSASRISWTGNASSTPKAGPCRTGRWNMAAKTRARCRNSS